LKIEGLFMLYVDKKNKKNNFFEMFSENVLSLS